MSLLPGTKLGPYEVLARLGAGGMGEVYRARDGKLDRDVAIKVLPESVAGDPDALARFEREAKAVAALSHPNVLAIHDFGNQDGIAYAVMELLEGETLREKLAAGSMAQRQALDYALQVAKGLSAAHEKGIVHRDLKPENLFVSRDGHLKILDFGLAKRTERVAPGEETRAPTVSGRTEPGTVMGTLGYMSPEQVRGHSVDHRSDIFSFGAILYELLSGKRAFQRDTTADTMSAILRDQPPELSESGRNTSPALDHIVARCLEKDPERRVQTAKDVRNELELVRSATPSSAPPAPRGGAHAAPVVTSMASIAVLPFANRGGDEEDEYFADGITEAVIAQLCKVRTLKVISRTSMMLFKNREESLREIALRLKVSSVLEGSIRRVADRVRIVAQLIDAASGQLLWAETYDRQRTDIFVIQTDVALHIAAALKAELSPNERERIRREPTRDVQAYEHYLRGRHSYVRFTTQEILGSIEHFDKAIERDPEFALAYVGLAMAYTQLGESGASGRDEAGSRAMAASARAVRLDAELGEAHCAHAYARLVYEFDWVGAEAGLKRALELSPGSADTYDLYGRLCAVLGRFDEAIALHERAYELDPFIHRTDLATTLLRAGRDEEATRAAIMAVKHEPDDPRPHATLGWALFRQGRVSEGLVELERAVTLMPGEDMWLAQLGQAYGLAGKKEKAQEVLQRLEDPSRPLPASSCHLAYVYTGLGDQERAMDYLERAFEEGAGPVFGIKGSILFAPLRHHPRFTALLKRMRLS